MGWTNILRGVAPSVILCLVSGCGAVDHFEPRALQYNQEAATTKSNTILLNILRAAHKLPLQFTEYTTTVGQSSLTGQIAATVPVATVPANAARTFTLNPQASGTAQTQLTIQNLNAQEFYYGLQTPLTQQMLATFMAIGYDRRMLLMIAVSSLKRKAGVVIDEIKNDASKWDDFAQFYDVINVLVTAGLNFESREGAAQGVGPMMTAQEAKALLPQYLTASATAAAGGSSNSLPTLKQKGDLFQLTKSASSFRICFLKKDLDALAARPSKQLTISENRGVYTLHLKVQISGPVHLFDMKVSPSHLCGAPAEASSSKSEGPLVDWDFELRSVEAIYGYLGKIVRVEWTDPNVFENVYQLPRNDGGQPFFLFKVHDGYAPGAVFSASLGSVYSVLPDALLDTDKSTQVISLLTDLWALESSAKSFPATSTVSVTTQ
ncbi:hypothetical protein [Bradyrhizobium sp. SRS-191]|uniref:hypothetical protein n=1 Tax=Bradyrhizobium sp. SRS-191 TaxID=2962606 RepID=UPI00211F436D|nr:hypothetical protein [Bradyrhizobium sp. SRS-191]